MLHVLAGYAAALAASGSLFYLAGWLFARLVPAEPPGVLHHEDRRAGHP